MLVFFGEGSQRKRTGLFLLGFLLLTVLIALLITTPTKAYAVESLGPYKSYDETQGTVITDVNGNVISGATIDINLLQQGVWVYSPMFTGPLGDTGLNLPVQHTLMIYEDVPIGQRESSHGGLSFSESPWFEPYHGYNVTHYLFKTLKTDATYIITVQSIYYHPDTQTNSEYYDDIFFERTLSLATSGTRDSSMNFGDESGDQDDGTGSEGTGNSDDNQIADTGENPQTGSSSNSTQNSPTSSDLAPNASPTDSAYSSASIMAISNNGSSGDLSATGSNASSGDGPNLITALAGRSSGASNISGETLASLGNIYSVGEESTTTVLEEESTEEATSIALSFIVNNLPYLYALLVGILLAALPLGFLKRVLATRYKELATTRIG